MSETSLRLGMAETQVMFRSDLEIHPEVDSGIIVKDPITRRFFRFTPVQASAIELLDGKKDLASIAKIVAQKHQTEVLEEQLADFMGKLQTLLLLDHPYCWAQLEKATKVKQKTFRNLLSIKIHAFNPDRLLAFLDKRLRFCFSTFFSVIVGSAITIAIIISILNAGSLFVSMGSLFSLYSIPLVIAVIFAVITVHEFGHGLALKRFGGKVEEMGFMLLYFIPAFYCNVSDAWMLKKRKRLLVSLAGGYIQIFIWALATISWRILSPETLASHMCVIIIAFSGIQTLFNFNPLIRLDGYYMLSDYVEVSNLRPKALAYLKDRFLSFVSGTPSGINNELSLREKRLLFWYGSSASLFTVVLIGIMFERIGGWIIHEYRFWGIILTSILFLATVPITKKENVQTSRRFFRALTVRIRKTPLIFMALTLIILIVGFLPWQLKISGDITILASRKVSVTPQVMGNLKRIYVEQGAHVRAGQLLAELENLELSNAYEETKGELAGQRASLDLLKAGSRPEEIEKARRQVETKNTEFLNASRIDQERAVLRETIAKREAELTNARLNYERSQLLWADKLIAAIEVDRDRTAYEVQKKELAEAKGQLDVLEEQMGRNQDIRRKEVNQARSELDILRAGPRKESIRAVESQVSKLEEKMNILEQQRDLLKIRSPIEGTVATAYLKNRIGDFLDKGDALCEIVSEGTVIVEMPIPEKEIGDVREGLPITLKVRGYPRSWYEARVKSIAPVAAASGEVRTVIVQGELRNSDESLRTGMTGVGKILCGKRTIFEIASRRAIRWIRTEFWEYLP
jgi:putative peptide zinc metalloprotease protein